MKSKSLDEVRVEKEDKLFSREAQLTRRFLIELLLGHDEILLGLALVRKKTIPRDTLVDSINGPVRVGPITDEHLELTPAYSFLYKWICLKFGEREIENGVPTVNIDSPIDTSEFFKKLKTDNILEELKELGAKIPERAYRFIKNVNRLKNKSKEEKLETSDFPPLIKSWEQVKLCALQDGKMEVCVAGEIFTDDQLKTILPEYLYILLFHIIVHGKPFDNNSISKKVFKKEYVFRLRKCLKEIFRLNEDPLPYNKEALVYEIKFKCESDLTEESFSPEDATPSGVPRKITRPNEQF